MFQSRLNNFIEPQAPRERSVIFRRINISYIAVEITARIVDFFVIVVAAAAGGIVYQTLCLGSDPSTQVFFGSGPILGLFYVYLGSARGMYEFGELLAPRPDLGRTFSLWAAAALLVAALLVVLRDNLGFPPAAVIAALPAQILSSTAALLGARLVFARAVRGLVAERSISGRRIVTIGEPVELLGLSSDFLLQSFGLTEVCRIAVGTGLRRHSGEVLADVDRAIAAAGENGAQEFLLALHWGSRDMLETIRTRLRASPLPVSLLPDHNMRTTLGQYGPSRQRAALPLRVQKAGLNACEKAAKRSLDVIAAGTAILLLWPILLVAAIAIKLDSKGPVIFRQKRTGLNAEEFVIFKFRTMTVLEDGPAITQARRDDHRFTRIGKFLRRSSIDELPQLFNVLRGEMSLVGPRPHAVAHDNEFKVLIAGYGFRHHVKPGMTGWAQVNGLRGETASLRQMAERVEMDQWYINNWSIGLDLRILVRTCFEVLRHQAY